MKYNKVLEDDYGEDAYEEAQEKALKFVKDIPRGCKQDIKHIDLYSHGRIRVIFEKGARFKVFETDMEIKVVYFQKHAVEL